MRRRGQGGSRGRKRTEEREEGDEEDAEEKSSVAWRTGGRHRAMLVRGRRRGGKVPRNEVCAGRGVEEGISGVVTPLKRGRERGSGGGEKTKNKDKKTRQASGEEKCHTCQTALTAHE